MDAKAHKAVINLEEIPTPPNGQVSAHVLASGPNIPAHQRVLLYSPDEWEVFIQEWLHYKKTQYHQVLRMAGSGDLGIDIAAFSDDNGLSGVWDNHQCKHYGNPLTPGDALPEVGKILWYTYQKKYAVPRKHYFIAPKDCGPKLSLLLKRADKLCEEIVERWNKDCAQSITSTQRVELEGEFLNYVQSFDFSVFTLKTAMSVIDEHRRTPYYVVRFGGGLPARPQSSKPPETPDDGESRYIAQLFEAYSDHKKIEVISESSLTQWDELRSHYDRQREAFYEAEALRNFARDNVPPGTFESLQDEVHDGVIEVESSEHPDALARMSQVLTAAAQTNPNSNGLISVVKVKDKKGICHQLANVDRLRWKK